MLGVIIEVGMQGKLIAGVHARVQVFKWARRDDAAYELMLECGHCGQIMALYLQTRGDFVLVGEPSEPEPLHALYNASFDCTCYPTPLPKPTCSLIFHS